MAKQLNESSTFTNTIVVPEDGDLRDAASVETPFQALADRTRKHEDVLFRLNGNPGIYRVRFVTIGALLRAITPHVQGDLCLVLSSAGGGRWYYYSASNEQDDDSEIILRPGDVAADQPGRWVALERIRTGTNGRLLAPHGLSVGGEASFDADISALASVTIGQLLQVLGAATLQNVTAHDITASGSINAGGSLGCTGDAGIGGELLAIGKVFAFDGLDVGTDLAPKPATITGKATLKGGADINGASTLTQPMVCSGGGHLRNRTRVMNTDADQTISVATTSWFLVPAGLLTAIRSVTVQDIGAGEGAEVEIITEEETRVVVVKNAIGETLVVLLNNPGSGGKHSARLGFLNGKWRVLSASLAFS